MIVWCTFMDLWTLKLHKKKRLENTLNISWQLLHFRNWTFIPWRRAIFRCMWTNGENNHAKCRPMFWGLCYTLSTNGYSLHSSQKTLCFKVGFPFHHLIECCLTSNPFHFTSGCMWSWTNRKQIHASVNILADFEVRTILNDGRFHRKWHDFEVLLAKW